MALDEQKVLVAFVADRIVKQMALWSDPELNGLGIGQQIHASSRHHATKT